MRQFKPLPGDLRLGKTLASRVLQLREVRNMTVRDLAKLSRLGQQRIEGIEAGIETWLSVSDRQLLAQALAVNPSVLQDGEMRPPSKEKDLGDANARLLQAILDGARDLECPSCGGTLKCSIQEALDIEGQPTRFAKAYCLKCPFILR